MQRTQTDTRPMGIIVIAIVVLSLTTGYIHLTLGSLLFTLNAIGYAGFALGIIVIATVRHPLVRRFDWMPRAGLAAYTATTIAAYLVIGPHFGLGWIAKAVEVAILALLLVDVLRAYGSPLGLVRAALASVGLGGEARPMRPA
jgi:hypothetical protein